MLACVIVFAETAAKLITAHYLLIAALSVFGIDLESLDRPGTPAYLKDWCGFLPIMHAWHPAKSAHDIYITWKFIPMLRAK